MWSVKLWFEVWLSDKSWGIDSYHDLQLAFLEHSIKKKGWVKLKRILGMEISVQDTMIKPVICRPLLVRIRQNWGHTFSPGSDVGSAPRAAA